MQNKLALKIFVILVLIVGLMIPIQMVRSKITDRNHYEQDAALVVAASWTGRQEVISPVLVLPYVQHGRTDKFGNKTANDRTIYHLVSSVSLVGQIEVKNKRVKKGIFEFPVFNSKIVLQGEMPAIKLAQQLDLIAQTNDFKHFGTPYLAVYLTDMRGINSSPRLVLNADEKVLEPIHGLIGFSGGLGLDVPELIAQYKNKNLQPIKFKFSMSLRGMGELSVLSLADEANIDMSSDWPHPEFVGASLPMDRQISADGFTATWLSTKYSSNSLSHLSQCINYASCVELSQAGSGVKFMDPVNVYVQSERATKYAVLFVGLSFILFFVFEQTKRCPIHPIQYAFVGLAISVFYLLLISLAEHIAFGLAYAAAALACSLLLLFYSIYIFKRLGYALVFFVALLALYSLLYVIVQAEDFALLMGSVLVFLVLVAMMISTRNLNWYSVDGTKDDKKRI